MEYFGTTDIGTRYSNEDSFLVQELPHNQVLAVVIDGCGAAGGAAHIFRDRLRDELDALGALDKGVSVEQLKSAVINVNNYMVDYRKMSADIGCCVLTACIVDGITSVIDIVHCGDCRAYCCSDEDLHQITIDDSYVGRLLYSGGLTESEARNHPMRHQIFKSLGHEILIGDENYISTYTHSASTGDYLLLTTDGIYDTLLRYEIKSITSRTDLSIEDKLNALVTLARENGSTDNATAILIKL